MFRHLDLFSQQSHLSWPSPIMNINDQHRSRRTPAAPLTVGTGGRVERMRGPCACPGQDATLVPHLPLMHRLASRTSTRPPPIPSSTPCPYRTMTVHDRSCLLKLIISPGNYPISITRLPNVSTCSFCPGNTTVDAAASSTTVGPSSSAPAPRRARS
jgi:hypothetical protein